MGRGKPKLPPSATETTPRAKTVGCSVAPRATPTPRVARRRGTASSDARNGHISTPRLCHGGLRPVKPKLFGASPGKNGRSPKCLGFTGRSNEKLRFSWAELQKAICPHKRGVEMWPFLSDAQRSRSSVPQFRSSAVRHFPKAGSGGEQSTENPT